MTTKESELDVFWVWRVILIFSQVGAMGIEGMKNVVFLLVGRDGTDGPTDAAGAICEGETIKWALVEGLDLKTVSG